MMGKPLNDADKKLFECLSTVNYNIEISTKKANINSNDIHLVAATKTVDADTINKAIKLGVKIIGENRVQELLQKYDDINKQDCNIHFIGHLQTNKVKDIVGKVNMIHSVDSLHLLKKISEVSKTQNITADVLIQVNIGNDKNKYGLSRDALEPFLYKASELKNVKIKGLMMIPPITNNNLISKHYFEAMNDLFIDIKAKSIDNVSMDFLSMGMSQDYIDAIKCGANMVRLGSCLFGNRN